MKRQPSAPPASNDDNVHYPSFPPPPPPPPQIPKYPVAQPVYQYQQAQYIPPQQQPLNRGASLHYVGAPPYVYKDENERESCIGMTFKLFVFHCLNAALGILGFTIVVTGVSLGFGLIPLCCFGIVVFRLVLYIVRALAQWDVELYNYISPRDEHVYLNIPQRAVFYGMEGFQLSPSLSSVSPLSLMATVYFLSIKFGVGILSSIVLAFPLSLPLAQLIVENTDADDVVIVNGIDVRHFNFDTDPSGFAVACICNFIIGLALMHLTARLSRAATRFFCCERFSTYRYIHNTQIPVAQYPSATNTYGTANY